MSFIVNKDWTTEAGLRAVVIEITQPLMFGQSTWHCGYVAVEEGSPLFGKDYQDRMPQLKKLFEELKQKESEESIFESYGAIDLLCMAFDDEEDPQLGYCLQVHGGVTYAITSNEYPVAVEKELHWIGYDCNHFDDIQLVQNLNFNIQQCESLAKQIAFVSKFLEAQDD